MTLIITVAALAVAASFGVVAWRATAAERSRSDARVAALSAIIDPSRASETPSLFVARPESTDHGHPLLKVGIGFAAVVALIVVAAMTNDFYEDAATASGALQHQPALALLSMGHEQDASGTLTITGRIRNESRTRAEGISAIVFAFDKAGGFITSGRAALDMSVLPPGETSSFRVVIPNVTDVGRYRVSFRSDAGILRHVDRRPRSAQPPGPIVNASLSVTAR
jgi:hypothetical protein